MRIADLIAEISRLFPAFPASAWTQSYVDALKRFEGEMLRLGWRATMAEWKDHVAPKPAHIARNCELIAKTMPAVVAEKLKAPPWEATDKAYQDERERIRSMLYRRYADLYEQANGETWAHLLMIHFTSMSAAVAGRIVRGMSEEQAIEDANRARRNPMPILNLWLDDFDIARWRQMGPQQARAAAGLHRGSSA